MKHNNNCHVCSHKYLRNEYDAAIFTHLGMEYDAAIFARMGMEYDAARFARVGIYTPLGGNWDCIS